MEPKLWHKVSAANVSCDSSAVTVEAAAAAATTAHRAPCANAAQQNVGSEKECHTGTGLGTISFCGYTTVGRTSIAEAGTGTISLIGENQQHHMAAETPCGDAASRSFLDSTRKEEAKGIGLSAPGTFKSSRLQPRKYFPLLGLPRRVLRSEDSTGSDESIEVADNHQGESKEGGPGSVGTDSNLLLLAGLKEELQMLRRQAAPDRSSSTEEENSSEKGSKSEVSPADDGSQTSPALQEQETSSRPDIQGSSPVQIGPESHETSPVEVSSQRTVPSPPSQRPEVPDCPKGDDVGAAAQHERINVNGVRNSCRGTPQHAVRQENVANNRQLSAELPKLAPPDRCPAGEAKETDASRRVRERENGHFVWVNDKRYQKLGKIGSGGSSHVFKVIAQDCTIYALKRIMLKGRDHQTACGFHQEIEYLERLRGKRHIIQLIDYEVTDKSIFRSDYSFDGEIESDVRIYMVLEYGETDLAHMLERKRNEDGDLDENWLRLYWEHILKAVNTIHEERIVHADLKPANFLLVQGVLKLIDFGIAKAIQNDTTNIVRESQVGTLNYMSPEAFMNARDDHGTVKCGRASDIWSLGCILYQMVYGRTPFSHLKFYQKIAEITNPKHKINFPPVSTPLLVDLMKSCLVWDKSKRPRLPELLEHPFLRPRPPEDHSLIREALSQSCKAYVSVRGKAQLTELVSNVVRKGPVISTGHKVDDVLSPFIRLYIDKAGQPALEELLTSIFL